MNEPLIDQLAATPSVLAHLVAESTDGELDAAEPGEWNPRPLLAHFRDTETLEFRLALERMIAEDVPTLFFIPADEWLARRSHARDRKDQLLTDFALQRQATLAILRSLQPTDWERRGRMPGREPFTVKQLVKLWARHDRSHITQLETALGQTLEEVKQRRARPEE